MPRAYYKPFTIYEEVVGFHGTRRNTYIFCGLLFGGLLFKMIVLSKYASVSDFSSAGDPESLARYQESVGRRLDLAERLSSREDIRRAIAARRAPPA
ncbi:hypothetical protein ERJ75_001537200 [Trypanosoma vivax]|uniref:Transmembrane protein n=1 Tax=Trypanosoma vivax (strain Y486) TaxID=1055687 RepID=G0U7Y7_TRYVY|nr:hypothetical protein ERJ75_001537200 [Trypanosoma vivax]CCC51995.1 conserved hypothetical protein [Trypanosoma vivax Y486]